jgi:NCAIR mutase (PurE)-related protein
MNLHELFKQVEAGTLSAEAAMKQAAQEADLGFARVDTDRLRRCGLTEVIYGPGKTVAQIITIMQTLRQAGQDVLVTRVEREKYDAIAQAVPGVVYHETARAVTLDVAPRRAPAGRIAVLCAGTSDLPVAEEAALTAERLGSHVDRFYDVGVAGLHRLVRHLDTIRAARVLIIVAGMEGALPSVVGGLVGKPIIAVPTSIGYGTNFKGISALLAMLNSCVPGISVVNIDNGFGAGVAAALINRVGEKETP